MKDVLAYRSLHFVGIGGIGMSGLAQVFLEMGRAVSGSDLEMNNLTRKIEAMGGKVFRGHDARHLPAGTEAVVCSSAVAEANPEVREARRRGVAIVHRSAALAAIFNGRKGIAVTGTHGKTTTTSMIAVILKEAGLDPTVVIGGEVSEFGGNAALGTGPYVVAEADESDGSFLNLRPHLAVVTNIEPEHLDHYASMGAVENAYLAFMKNVKRGGTVFYNAGEAPVRAVVARYGARAEGFGLSADAALQADAVAFDGFRTVFTCRYRGKRLGKVELSIPGMHNVQNALAAILVGRRLGVPFAVIVRALKKFGGAKRRFQLRAERDGVMVIDDYAHHPTEIRAVLDASGSWQGRRRIAVFQPHRFSRTKHFAEEFGKSFARVDKLILTDIYAASEKPIRGVSVRNIYAKVRAHSDADVMIMAKEEIPGYLLKIKKPGDMIFILGAGDIKKVADILAERLGGDGGSGCGAARILRRTLAGTVKTAEALAGRTSFRIGGPADLWIEPRDRRDLQKALRLLKERGITTFVIGNGTNLLVSDAGFRGAVIHLGAAAFRKIRVSGDRITVGAGFSLPQLVKRACAAGLGGLESLVGIPGTVGGALCMNAGGWTNPIYKNIGELVESVTVMDRDGAVRRLRREELIFDYRRSNLAPFVILEAALHLRKTDRQALTGAIVSYLKMKREKQALDMPSAGCVFKNPAVSSFTAGQMIDMLGFKGTRVGGAEVSGKHANFIVNRGGASAADVLSLIGTIKERVEENYRIPLELEIKVL